VGDGVKADRPDVIPERPPGGFNVMHRSAGKLLDRRVLPEKLLILGNHPIDLGLLQHHLRDQDLVRVGGFPPREIPPIAGIPAEESLLEFPPEGKIEKVTVSGRHRP
jgi:hypothetical protein